jgi:hypothetical protein
MYYLHCEGSIQTKHVVSPTYIAKDSVINVSYHDVGLGGIPGPSREGLERSLTFKRWTRARCFRCLECENQVSACHDYFRCIRWRCPVHRESFCRTRSPAAHDHSPVTRAPAPCQRSCSPAVQPCQRALTRSWVEVMGRSSSSGLVPLGDIGIPNGHAE